MNSTASTDGTAVNRASRSAHSRGFWIAAIAFLLNMAFSAVPTPLYAIYAQRDHLDSFQITIIFAVYAAGVIGSLFLGGHVSDWVGRKTVFIPALLVNVVSAVMFIIWPSFDGLIVARIVSGVSVGLTTATATAYLAELHLGARPGAPGRRAQVIATAANLGGIGFGPLAAGMLAQFAPAPLQLSYVVFAAAIMVLALLIGFSPETALIPEPRPRYRPQRIAVPRGNRRQFIAATAAGMASFAVYGLFNSLVPSFLSVSLHEHSHAVAGAVAFSAFAAGAIAQIAFARWGSRAMLLRSVPMLVIGLALFMIGIWSQTLAVFVLGGVVTGAGAGLLFRAALVVAGDSADLSARAEVLAGYFLGSYVGLSVPVIGLGFATEYFPSDDVMIVFIGLVVLTAGIAVLLLTRRHRLVASPRDR